MADQIFIMGLPRSGSTLLSRLLNETDDILSINDLYYIQTVSAENALNRVLQRRDVEKLVDWILDLAIERGAANNSFIGQFTVTKKEVDLIRQEIVTLHQNKSFHWANLMDAVLTRLAAIFKKTRWADKTPQNFMRLELLSNAFPQAQFLFLFRDPRNIMSSYKFAGGEGHDKRRYHPFFYALYWRTAVRKFIEVNGKMPSVAMIRYEDLVANTEQVVQMLNRFLRTKIRRVNLNTVGGNSSFAKGHRKSITETEKWLCQTLCRHEMATLGYERVTAKPRFHDLPELVFMTIRFACFQAMRMLVSKDSRQRIVIFFLQLFRKKC